MACKRAHTHTHTHTHTTYVHAHTHTANKGFWAQLLGVGDFYYELVRQAFLLGVVVTLGLL